MASWRQCQLLVHRSRAAQGVKAYSAAVQTPTVSGESKMAKDTAGKVGQPFMHACRVDRDLLPGGVKGGNIVESMNLAL